MSKRGISVKREKIKEAIFSAGGFITQTAELLGVERHTVSRWRHNDVEIAEWFEEAVDNNLDIAETKLMENIKAGKEASVFFYLKCKGKARGFIERQQFEHMGGMSFSAMGDKELQNQIDKRLKRAKDGVK